MDVVPGASRAASPWMSQLDSSLECARTVHSEHLRQLGLLSAGVAHDLRHILHDMSLRVEMLAHSDVTDEMMTHVAALRHLVQNALIVLDRLYEFGRATNDVTIVELRDLVHDACELARLRLASGGAAVSIVEDHGAASLVQLRAAEMLSAMLDLVVQAVDVAAAQNGVVFVKTGGAGDEAWLEVSNEAAPIVPSEDAERALSQAGSSVRAHGGRMTVESSGRDGVAIRLWLPRTTPTDQRFGSSFVMPQRSSIR